MAMRNWLEYIPFIIFASILRRLPRNLAHGLGRWVGRAGQVLQKKRAKIAQDNLRHAFPEMSDEEREHITRAVFENLGLGFTEMIRLDMLKGKAEFEQLYTIEGEENIHKALADGHGGIILTGHVGFWEAGGIALPMLGFPIGVVAKAMRNPLVDAYFRRMRQSYGGYIIESRKGARKIVRALQQNHLVGILMDQHIKRTEAIQVPFFGRPAHTTPIISQIAMKYRVPIIPSFAYRTEGDRYLVRFGEPFYLEGDINDSTIVANTALLTQIIEDGIRCDISQWFWIHRRWRKCCAS